MTDFFQMQVLKCSAWSGISRMVAGKRSSSSGLGTLKTAQVLSATNRKLYWELLYDPDGKTYAFSVLPVERAEYDASGNRTTMFVK